MTNLPNPVLTGTRCYLGGPIEHGGPENWRTNPSRILREEFEINLFDPAEDPKQKWEASLRIAREKRDYKKMRKIARKFVRKDLCIVDRCDFNIFYLPYKVPTTGTHEEIVTSNRNKKPTLLICPEGKEFLPFWYFGTIPLRYLFGSWDDVYTYLDEVNQKKHKSDFRWSFTYDMI